MSNADEIWNGIKKIIVQEQIIEIEEFNKIEKRLESGQIRAGDWKLVIENTLIKDERDD